MKKENENIHLHIIKEDYRTLKKKQNEHFEVSGKALTLSDLKNNAFIVEQLKKQHENFAQTNQPELLQPPEDPDQTEQQNSNLSRDSLDVSELFATYEKLKKEEQDVADSKQNLLAMEQSLRNRLTLEICKKKKTIEELQVEITALQNTCEEIKLELDT
jgi:hypothetical protein